jgi:hypothetical protein
MKRLAGTGLAALVAAGLISGPVAWSLTAAAAEQFRVVGVNRPDVLNIRSGPSASRDIVGTIPPGSRGIEGLGQCQRGWCLIRFGSVEGWVNARYIAPDRDDVAPEESEAQSPVRDVQETQPPQGGPGRSVLADGTMEFRRADGSALRLTADGRDILVAPDGTERSFTYLQVQTNNLPPLPPEYANWGNRVGEDLLGILKNILTAREMDAYLKTENGKSYYELVQWRLRSITFLTRPAS